ncbi:hypothetical protein [Agromyces marinus]|uniref:Uncharacterized protein n=1 Tax=Agromyces marinus TaxID=1389020 RepID=A0ABM8H3B1_9MICO|nr:hypothetical protein [Agromyces marinus]UIP59660.1 hypothetical protein DSM26151_25740 [Agromyces marinus]BDZ55268.1 hypothetical protein GCM10025870_23410 [Agromyces marinus]
MTHTIDHAHIHVGDLSAVAISTGGVRVIRLTGTASCPSELWRVDVLPCRPPAGGGRGARLALELRSAPPRRRGRFRAVTVPFEAIIEDGRTEELEVRLECQPAIILPVVEADNSFGSGAKQRTPHLARPMRPAFAI